MGVRLLVGHSDEPTGIASFDFDQTRIAIGRGAACDVRLPHRTVSQHHATIRFEHGQWVLVDEGSMNGTHAANGKLVSGRPKPLKSGDSFSIAGIPLTFQASVAFSEPTTPERTAAHARRMLRELFAPEARVLEAARLCVREPSNDERVIELERASTEWLVGRDEHCSVRLGDPGVSNEHALLVRDADGVRVLDKTSKNGTFVNGKPASDRRLRDGDELRVGGTSITYEDPAESRLRALEADSDEAGSAPWMPKSIAPEAPVAEPIAGDTAPKNTAPLAHSEKKNLGADGVVFIIAAVVLATSLAGLVWLLR